MTKKMQVFKCKVCGNIIEVVHESGGTLTCCNQPMLLMEENTVDAAKEKHAPVVEKAEGGYKVAVGSVLHPMDEKHWIEWIELIAGNEIYRKWLNPGDTPVAFFKTDATDAFARAYCNLHGFWKS